MKYFTEFMLYALAIMVFIGSLSFGFDREMARRDYERAVRNGDYEAPIVGCLWKYNCEYYTDLLYSSED